MRVNEFFAQLQVRIEEAERLLAAAQADGDDYSATVHTGELDSLRRLARQHGLRLPVATPV